LPPTFEFADCPPRIWTSLTPGNMARMPSICAAPGCGKPSWNGMPGEYCSRSCRPSDGQAACPAPGCGKPSWNGKPGEFCSRSCRASGAPAICPTPGCGRPSWNGQPGEHCSHACRAASAGVGIAPVSLDKYAELQAQFQGKWKGWENPPSIAAIWSVQNGQLLRRHADYCKAIGDVPVKPPGRSPGNQQRRFHATTMLCGFAGTPCDTSGCNICSIIRTGFQLSRAGGGLYGRGIYSSATSSKAYCYGNRRAMFIVGVAVGVAEQSSASTSDLQSGCHSRVVTNSDDELIVFAEAAIVPKYLIVFSK